MIAALIARKYYILFGVKAMNIYHTLLIYVAIEMVHIHPFDPTHFLSLYITNNFLHSFH